MKILLKNSLMNPEINHKILHSKKNIINISSEEEYVSDCCSSDEIEEENVRPENLKKKKTLIGPESLTPKVISKRLNR